VHVYYQEPSSDQVVHCRGGKFLKRWMAHLEENADIRYPDLNDLDFSER